MLLEATETTGGASAPGITQWLLIAAAILIATLMLRGMRRGRGGAYRERSRSRSDPGHSYTGSGMPPPAEYDAILVKLQEVAREIEGRLDTRVRVANRVLEELRAAEERIRLLTDDPHGASAARGAGTPATTAAPEPDVPLDPAARDRAEARRLFESGMTTPKIAVALGRPVGEVELMLALGRPSRRAKTP